MSRELARDVRRWFEAEYEPPRSGYRERLRAIPDRDPDRSGAHWSLVLVAAGVAALLIGVLVASPRLSRSGLLISSGPALSGGSPAAGVTWVRPVSGQEAWVVAGGDLWRTDDGGGHWSRTTPSGAAGSSLSVQALSREQAWAVSSRLSRSGWRSRVYTTSDGGQHWSAGVELEGRAGAPFFVDAQHGWLLSSLGTVAGSEAVIVYRTSDGGQSWAGVNHSGDQVRGSAGSLPASCRKSQIGFDDLNRGWIGGFCAGGPAALFMTSDGGSSWAGQTLPAPGGSGRLEGELMVEAPIFFSDDDAVLAVSQPSVAVHFYVTHDGGASWTLAASLAGASRPAVTSLRDWVVAEVGRLRASHDGGASWSDLPNGLDPSSTVLALISPGSGWAWQPGALYRTTDGFRTWTRVPLPGT